MKPEDPSDPESMLVPYHGEINMGNSVYSTPIVSGNTLYISNRTHLFAIDAGDAE